MGDTALEIIFGIVLLVWPVVFIACCVIAKKSKGDGIEPFLFGIVWPFIAYFVIGCIPIVALASPFGLIYYLVVHKGKTAGVKA